MLLSLRLTWGSSIDWGMPQRRIARASSAAIASDTALEAPTPQAPAYDHATVNARLRALTKSPQALGVVDPMIQKRLAQLVKDDSLNGVAKLIRCPRSTLASYLAGCSRAATVTFVQLLAAAHLGTGAE